MSDKKKAVAWLPMAGMWNDFLAEFGAPLESPVASGDVRLTSHAEAVQGLVDLLNATDDKEPWLILSSPALAKKIAPDCDLATQSGLAGVAVKLAERRELTMGVKIEAGAIGLAVVRQPDERWQLDECERRGKVIIFNALLPNYDSSRS